MGSSWEKRGPVRSARWRQVLRRTVTASSSLGPFFTSCTPLSLLPPVTIHGLASPCALSRFVTERGKHQGLTLGSTEWCLSQVFFPSPMSTPSSADRFFSSSSFRVDSSSFPPHSFISMFVLLFALQRLGYVCVYLCRLTLLSYYIIPDSLVVTRT